MSRDLPAFQKAVKNMCCNFYWQSGWGSNQCGCNSCSSCNGCSQSGNSCGCRQCGQSSSATEYLVNYRYRFLDMPMQVYYGPGYTEQDVLESIDSSLQTMSRRSCRG